MKKKKKKFEFHNRHFFEARQKNFLRIDYRFTKKENFILKQQ